MTKQIKMSAVSIGGDIYNDDKWDITIRQDKLTTTLHVNHNELKQIYNLLKDINFLTK